MSLILHLGMPKCASSALQTYLSTPVFGKDTQGRYAYIAIKESGAVTWGEELAIQAAASPYAYIASARNCFSQYADTQRRNIRAQIRELAQQFEHLVLSCEAWGGNPDLFQEDCIFADPHFDVRAVIYIRPQIEWMNSAWWQWGAWSGSSLSEWVKRNRSKANWNQVIQAWRRKKWIRQIDVRVLDEDIVQDFVTLLGCYTASIQPHSNHGLPGVLLRLFQQNRELRQTAHSSAIEFILARQLQFNRSYAPTPWVLRPKLIHQLTNFYRHENEALLSYLLADQKNRIANNSLWWDANAYADRPLHKAMNNKIQQEELERLAVDALLTIGRLDAKVREYQADWLRFKDKIVFEPGDDKPNVVPIRSAS